MATKKFFSNTYWSFIGEVAIFSNNKIFSKQSRGDLKTVIPCIFSLFSVKLFCHFSLFTISFKAFPGMNFGTFFRHFYNSISSRNFCLPCRMFCNIEFSKAYKLYTFTFCKYFILAFIKQLIIFL